MPISIESLKQKSVKVPVEFFGETVNVVYDPHRLWDPAFRTEYNDRASELEAVVGDWITAQASQKPEDGASEDEAPPNESQSRLDTMELSRRIWAMRGELVEMLIKSWDIELDGKPLPVTASVFTDGTLPPELAEEIKTAVWADVRSLGGQKTSPSTANGSRAGRVPHRG